ncbi:hypothetical protein HanIR_Chr11g0539381 [Helianthus annuus]|nr:hypothetical protein HanIR_Chr11g0539381 [Helianthus annuus]
MYSHNDPFGDKVGNEGVVWCRKGHDHGMMERYGLCHGSKMNDCNWFYLGGHRRRLGVVESHEVVEQTFLDFRCLPRDYEMRELGEWFVERWRSFRTTHLVHKGTNVVCPRHL